MRAGTVIIAAGVLMVMAGTALFYSIEAGQTDAALRLVKNAGTFAGLAGMGVTLAGILLYLINKGESSGGSPD